MTLEGEVVRGRIVIRKWKVQGTKLPYSIDSFELVNELILACHQ
jgi:hypothetical protein